jgi:hypothetical protein
MNSEEFEQLRRDVQYLKDRNLTRQILQRDPGN